MNFFDLNFWQGFVGNLFATVIGVIIGIPIAFWINRRAEIAIEVEKTDKVIKLLGMELHENYCHIIDVRNPITNDETIIELATLGPTLKDELWSTFSDGGELQWVKRPAVIGAFAQIYGEIKTIKYLADKCFKYIDQDPKAINAEITTKLRSSIDITTDLIPWILLNTELRDLVKKAKESYEKKKSATEKMKTSKIQSKTRRKLKR
jgi:hypothetical protein